MQHVQMFLYCHRDIYSCIATVYILGVSLRLNIFKYIKVGFISTPTHPSTNSTVYGVACVTVFGVNKVLECSSSCHIRSVSDFTDSGNLFVFDATEGSGREAQLAELATARVSRAAALGNLF